MPTTKKQLLLLFLFTVLLLVAAQCGIAAVPPERQNQPVTEEQRSNISEAEPHAPEHELEAVELAPVNLAEGEKLQVVATTSIVADVVRQVGGDLIDLTPLLPLGTDPLTVEPAPRDLATVADAHVVFANGMGLEEFLDDMIENTGGEFDTNFSFYA